MSEYDFKLGMTIREVAENWIYSGSKLRGGPHLFATDDVFKYRERERPPLLRGESQEESSTKHWAHMIQALERRGGWGEKDFVTFVVGRENAYMYLSDRNDIAVIAGLTGVPQIPVAFDYQEDAFARSKWSTAVIINDLIFNLFNEQHGFTVEASESYTSINRDIEFLTQSAFKIPTEQANAHGRSVHRAIREWVTKHPRADPYRVRDLFRAYEQMVKNLERFAGASNLPRLK